MQNLKTRDGEVIDPVENFSYRVHGSVTQNMTKGQKDLSLDNLQQNEKSVDHKTATSNKDQTV